MPTVFASVSATIILFYLATLVMAYFHLMPVGLHMLWGCFMALLIIFLQCLVFGFFINSGKSIKKVVQDNGLSPDWIQKTKDYKNRCYPMLMLALLVSVAAAVVGGGVSVGAVPVWIHELLVWAAFGINVYSLALSYRVVVENVKAIHRINDEVGHLKMAGGPAEPAAEPLTRPPTPPEPKPADASSKFYFLAVTIWVPYLYMRFSLGSRTFPFWPFLALSGLCLLTAWWGSRKRFPA
jgi:hypothetical protein